MRAINLVRLVAVATCLSACSGDSEEIQTWIEQQQHEAKPKVAPIAPPRKFEPQAYEGVTGTEPFSLQKLAAANRTQPQQSSAVLDSELKRRKQPLEAYPLDSMSMVGSVNREGRPFALLRVEGLLHYVKVGDYVGQNFGKIVSIQETDISIREIVQDSSGEWVERNSNLQLQETSK